MTAKMKARLMLSQYNYWFYSALFVVSLCEILWQQVIWVQNYSFSLCVVLKEAYTLSKLQDILMLKLCFWLLSVFTVEQVSKMSNVFFCEIPPEEKTSLSELHLLVNFILTSQAVSITGCFFFFFFFLWVLFFFQNWLKRLNLRLWPKSLLTFLTIQTLEAAHMTKDPFFSCCTT